MPFVRPDDTIHELEFRPLIEEDLFVLGCRGRPSACTPMNHTGCRSRKGAVHHAFSGVIFRRRSGASSTTISSVALLTLRLVHEAETLPMVISFVLSSRGITLLPAYMRGLVADLGRRAAAGWETADDPASHFDTVGATRRRLLYHLLSQAADPISSSA